MQVLVGERTKCWPPTTLALCEMAEKPFGAYGVGNTFPKEASNTEDWLDAIGLVRSALAASQSPIVTRVWCLRPAEPLQGSSSGHEPGRRREHDRQREEGESADRRPTQASGGVLSAHTQPVPSAHGSAAHLRPLTAAQVLALQALSPITEERHEAASAPTSTSSPQVKYNSTSSLYIDSTITKPCTEEMIFCVAVVLHDRINEGEQATAEAAAKGETLPRFKVDSKDLMQVVD